MRKSLVFVNYEHPSHIRDRTRRRIVSTHTGKYSQELLRSSQRTGGREIYFQEQSVANEWPSGCPQPSPSAESLQLAQAPSHHPVRTSSRSPFRRGVIIQEKRQCVFDWQHRQQKPGVSPVSNERGHSDPSTLQAVVHPTSPPKYDNDVLRESLEFNYGSFRPRSPLDVLSQGRGDPFVRFAVDEDYTPLWEAFDHGIRHFWPMIAPSKDGKSYQKFLDEMTVSPLAYYAYLIGVLANFDWMHGNHPKKHLYTWLRARSIYQTIRLVREHLEKLQGPPPDQLITFVLILATVPSGVIQTHSSLPISRFRSPLADAQILDPYGTLQFTVSHWTAFYSLVQMKGELDRVGNREAASLWQLGDLTISSKQSTAPRLPYHNLFVNSVEVHAVDDDIRGDGFLASSLSAIARSISIFSLTGLERAVRTVTQATLVLGKYYADNSPSTFLRLIELRNRAQWRSLVVKRSPSMQMAWPKIPKGHWSLFELTRLALLAYNNLVIYPLSPTNEVGIRLARELKSLLEISLQKYPDHWHRYPRLFIWVLMLGGISDASDLERQWYRHRFHLLCSSPQLLFFEWVQIEESLTSFLWEYHVLNDEAIKFWVECTTVCDCHANG